MVSQRVLELVLMIKHWDLLLLMVLQLGKKRIKGELWDFCSAGPLVTQLQWEQGREQSTEL
jgi:hypothetical protein